MTSYTNTEKRIWEQTPVGKLATQLKKLYANKELEAKWDDDKQRKVDIMRATSLSKERDITDDFQKRAKALEDEYNTALEKQVTGAMQEEIDFLIENTK